MYEPAKKILDAASSAIATSLSQEASEVKALREFNAQARAQDPAKIAWSATLPIELALKTATPQELRIHYGYTDEEWDALRDNPVFLSELASACDLVKKEGMSFRLKCKLQAEELLNTGWRLIHAPNSEVPPAVKEKLMAGVYRMAGFDVKDGTQGPATGFAIQINFSGREAREANVIQAGG